MSFEIEKKYRLTEARRMEVVADLKEMGAEYVGREAEENTIYSNDVLRQTASILRIRTTEQRNILTFKRRVEGQFDVKKQIEHETEVSDTDALKSIVAELGLKPAIVYEKNRDTWNFRSVELVIDELPFGLFMEIEGSVTGIKEAEMLLGLDDLETEHETYPRLTARLGVKNGDVVEARFEKAG